MLLIFTQNETQVTSQSLLHQVSVSDSIDIIIKAINRAKASQSLLHQVSVSDFDWTSDTGSTAGDTVESQSLLHQVSVSDTDAQFLTAINLIASSQSLLHQVSVSDRRRCHFV